MSDADKITAILSQIQTDSQLLALLRLSVTRNLPNVPSAQLDAICTILGIDITQSPQ